MKIIVGLGNPEKNYKGTRHNIGFEAINKLSQDFTIPINKNKFKAHIGEGFFNNKKIILVKPQTFMNLSGQSVSEILNFYQLSSQDIIVVYDDISLDVGKIRIRQKGSSGGQNGVKNIISSINTDEFLRIRIGIGNKPTGYNLSDYVLSSFKKDELPFINDGLVKACDSIELILKDELTLAMNKFN